MTAAATCRLQAAKNIHEDMLEAMIHAPIDWYDVTPIGRILNRFSKDTNAVDLQLVTMCLFALITSGFCVVALLALLFVTRGIGAVFLIPTCYVFARMFVIVRSSAIQIRRLESVARSPIYSSFSEVLNGLPAVRAFGATNIFAKKNVAAVNSSALPFFISRSALPSWLMIRLQSLASVALLSTATFCAVAKDMVSPGLMGLGLMFGTYLVEVL